MFAVRDPDVEELLTWFDYCYDVDVHPLTGRTFFRRVNLPDTGGVGDQDARLLHGIGVVAEIHQAVMDENAKRAARAAQKDNG